MKAVLYIIAFVLATGFANALNYGCPFMNNGYYGSGFMWLFNFILWALVIIALVLLIMWLIRQLQTNNRRR